VAIDQKRSCSAIYQLVRGVTRPSERAPGSGPTVSHCNRAAPRVTTELNVSTYEFRFGRRDRLRADPFGATSWSVPNTTKCKSQHLKMYPPLKHSGKTGNVGIASVLKDHLPHAVLCCRMGLLSCGCGIHGQDTAQVKSVTPRHCFNFELR